MEEEAIAILDSRRIMTIATLRPDGWPQATIVGYANDGLLLYFLIWRTSQKLANIQHDDRVAVAIGEEPKDFDQAKAVYAGAHASEVTDQGQREQAWRLLVGRHPNLADFELPDRSQAAMMRASCKYVSILDYTQGFGHTDSLTIDSAGLALADPPGDGDRGPQPAEGPKGNS